MAHLSDRVNLISESQTIAMARKSRELKAQGIDIISLSLGEPDFNTPDVIKQAAIDAINDNFTYYNDYPDGTSVTQRYKRFNCLQGNAASN